MTESEIEALADALAARQPRIPIEVDLWGTKEIAAYLKMIASQVGQRYAPRPDFPKAIRLPTHDGHRSHPRWKAVDVIAWAEKYLERRRAV
jgi:predicted DNA-binding transcriptional regulator AlpA